MIAAQSKLILWEIGIGVFTALFAGLGSRSALIRAVNSDMVIGNAIYIKVGIPKKDVHVRAHANELTCVMR